MLLVVSSYIDYVCNSQKFRRRRDISQYFIVMQTLCPSTHYLLLVLWWSLVVSGTRADQCQSHHQSVLLNKTSACERRDHLVDLR